jgi:NADP-dependent 3-hydroxy acid dehydrogenase YdfG
MAAARRGEELRKLAEEAPQILTCTADVTDRVQVDRLVATTLERLQAIDLLVYAAGTNVPQRALNVLSPDTWDSVLAVNLTGAYNCTRSVLPAMRARSNGMIIYISSAAVRAPDLSGVSYQASKHGLSGLAHGTRLEEKLNGIRTSTIFLGLCRTEMINRRPVPTPEEVLRNALEPEDVAEAVLAIAQLHPRVAVPEMDLLPSRL